MRWLVVALLSLPSLASAAPDSETKVMSLLESSRLEDARPLVDAEHGAVKDVLAGAYDFYDGAYAKAIEEFDRALASGELDAHLAGGANELRELAKRTFEVTQGFVARRSEHFEIKVAPGQDELLAEPALETLEKALAAVAGDLGDPAVLIPRGPIRVEIYGDARDLAKASPLTITEIETSGTIALCKFNRLMAISPRALMAGYPWMDTIAHELVHYVISRASHNTVPIWLHEGIAKIEERRWREPFGGALPLQLEHVLASGIKANHLITFAQMHPSMALLPSQEDAALAYAEVATAVQFLTEGRGTKGLRDLFAQLREHGDLSRAIASVTGSSFAKFEQKWRVWLKERGYKTHPELGMQKLVFRTAEKKTHDDDEPVAHSGDRSPTEAKAMGHVRLGGMLRSRGRLSAAATEYERATALLGAGHPEVAARLGRTYLELKAWDRAIAAAKPGLARRPDSAGLHVTVGKALLEKGDTLGARSYLEGALAVNPFDPTTRCGLRRVYESLHDARAGREAAACATLGGQP
jgi:hypothetical protein